MSLRRGNCQLSHLNMYIGVEFSFTLELMTRAIP